MTDPDHPQDEPKTVFVPSGTSLSSAVVAPPAAAGPAPAQTASTPTPGRVQIGSVLNHIYEVKRFIARGGMGEVYEGANINSDERVAVKVMLPQLAADPNVQEMFRREAQALLRISHPALVQYRLLTREPQLDVWYIVTEFIDGEPLSEVLGRLHPDEAELRTLLRRLAEGLKTAHDLEPQIIHRDVSPDNVLLPGGRLDRAKIIDFGIAKDLDASKATIVGDGFAGKLGYVAPEQFGDFSRQIGPWTDVYSLGLVILAAALGRDVDMGVTLVEAVDKRRAGPDLSPIPAGLRSVLEGMLAADPAARFKSMNEVLSALESGAGAVVRPAPSPPAARPGPGPGVRIADLLETWRTPPRPLLLGGGLAGLVVLGLMVAVLSPKHPHQPAVASPGPAAAGASSSPVSRADAARRAVEAALPGIPCTWLELDGVTEQAGGVALKLAGVAGSPAAAQAAVVKAAGGSTAPVTDVDLAQVAPVGSPNCAPLNVYRSIRARTSQTGQRLSVAQRMFQIMRQSNGAMSARAVVDLNLGDPTLDFALVGLEPSGALTPLINGRGELTAAVRGHEVAEVGADHYRFPLDTSHTGWSGLLLLTGRGPFDAKLIAPPVDARDSDWLTRFRQAAAANGWAAEMAWYKTVE